MKYCNFTRIILYLAKATLYIPEKCKKDDLRHPWYLRLILKTYLFIII